MYVILDLSTREVFNLLWAAFILYSSLPVLQNMASKKQKQNKYFESFRMVNSYGKFGRLAALIIIAWKIRQLS